MAHVIEDSFSESLERKRYIENNRQLALENSKKDRLLKEIYDENFRLKDQLQEALRLAEKKDAEIKIVRQQMDLQIKFLHNQLYRPLREFCEGNQLTNYTSNDNTNNNDTYSLNNNQSLADSPESIDQQASLLAVEEDQSLERDIETDIPTNNPERLDYTDHNTEDVPNQQALLSPISEKTEHQSTQSTYNDSLEPRDVTAYIPSLRTEYQFTTPSIYRFDDDLEQNPNCSAKTITPEKIIPATPERNSVLRLSTFSFLRPDQHSTPVLSPAPKKKIIRKRAAPEPSDKVTEGTTPKRRYNLRNRK